MIHTCSTEQHMHKDTDTYSMGQHIHETKALPNPPALEYSNQTASEELWLEYNRLIAGKHLHCTSGLLASVSDFYHFRQTFL